MAEIVLNDDVFWGITRAVSESKKKIYALLGELKLNENRDLYSVDADIWDSASKDTLYKVYEEFSTAISLLIQKSLNKEVERKERAYYFWPGYTSIFNERFRFEPDFLEKKTDLQNEISATGIGRAVLDHKIIHTYYHTPNSFWFGALLDSHHKERMDKDYIPPSTHNWVLNQNVNIVLKEDDSKIKILAINCNRNNNNTGPTFSDGQINISFNENEIGESCQKVEKVLNNIEKNFILEGREEYIKYPRNHSREEYIKIYQNPLFNDTYFSYQSQIYSLWYCSVFDESKLLEKEIIEKTCSTLEKSGLVQTAQRIRDYYKTYCTVRNDQNIDPLNPYKIKYNFWYTFYIETYSKTNDLGSFMLLTEVEVVPWLLQIIYQYIKDVYTLIREIENDFRHKTYIAKIRNESLKSAIASIMARNMSHNIGSHVITNTKSELERLALNNKNLQSKLLGLSKLMHYIQERQDFIAVLSSGENYTKGPINLKEHIFDYLAYDGPSIRHNSREHYNNFILDNIVSSENITRYGNQKKIEICMSYRDGEDMYSLKSLKSESLSSRKLDSISFAIPYGLNGRQAFLTIIENFLRNSAKHLHNDILDVFLEITIHVEKLVNSYKFLIFDNKNNFDRVISNINRHETKIIEKISDGSNLFRIIPGSLKILDYSDSKPEHNHKGLKEMLICLAWMKGIDNYGIIEKDPTNDLGFYIVNNDGNYGISFTLDCFEESLFLKSIPEGSEVTKEDGVFFYDEEDLNTSNISQFISSLPPADIYILDKENENNSRLSLLQRWLPRVVLYEKDSSILNLFQNSINCCLTKGEYQNSTRLDISKEIDVNRIRIAYYLNKSFEANNVSILSNNLLSSFNYSLSIIDKNGKDLINSVDPEERVLASFVRFIKNDEVETNESISSSHYIQFINHYEILNNKSDFIRSLPEGCFFLEGVSGGNYTNSLIRNSIFTFKHFVKVVESCMTRVTIIDERLYKKYLNPESSFQQSSTQGGILSLNGFTDFLKLNPPSEYNYDTICSKLIDYSISQSIKLIKNKIEINKELKVQFDEKLSYFENNESRFDDFMGYFDIERDRDIKKSWGSYLKGKNVHIFDIEACNMDLNKVIFKSVCGKDEDDKKILKDSHFISIHYGIIEKLNEQCDLEENLFHTLSGIFKDLRCKIAIHSGRGDLHRFKDKSGNNLITFIPLSGIEWALENSKFMLTELFYNQKYYPINYK